MTLKWYGPERMDEIKAKVRRNMSEVMAEMDTDIKTSMRTTPRGEADPQARSGSRSLPGHPPAVQTALLIGSIQHKVEDKNNSIVGTVGSHEVIYAAPLEFGTPKMAPRPFLMPALERIKDKIAEKLIK